MLAATILDPSFESIPEGSGVDAYAYSPSGSAWTFGGDGSGVSGNDSAFTNGNPVAPDGNQVAFLQSFGRISQSIAAWDAGTYQISIQAAQRGVYGNVENFQVLVDGSVVTSFTPTDTNYRTYTTPVFRVAAGDHTISFQGIDIAQADNTALIDAVSLTPVTTNDAVVNDPGFETFVVGSGHYIYDPGGSPWSYSLNSGVSGGGSGVSGNGSAFTNGTPPAPQGAQVAFLQSTGTITQSVDDWAAGTYQISFQAIQRGYDQTSSEDFEVLLDGGVVGTFNPSGSIYQTYTTDSFPVTVGTHSISFQGLDSAGGDNTAFIDQVQVNQISGSPVGSTDLPIVSFLPDDPTAVPSDFTASIDWGDGIVTPGTVSAEYVSQLGGFGVFGSHTFAHAGLHDVTVTVNSPSAGQMTLTNTLYTEGTDTPESGEGPSFVIPVGQTYNDTVAAFTSSSIDTAASDFAASIDWGDGTVTSGTVATAGTLGEYQVLGTHTFTASGTIPVTVEIDSADGTSLTLSGSASVAVATLSATGDSISVDAGTEFDGEVATLNDSNLYAGSANLTATINWGDSTTSTTGEIDQISAGQFSIGGTHTFATAGNYSIRVALADQGQGISTATGTASVASPSGGAANSSAVASTVKQFTGRFAATVAAFAVANNSSATGALSISGIPQGSTIVYAMLYAGTQSSSSNFSVTFANQSIGMPTTTKAADIFHTYIWDVKALVSGNGTYSVSLRNFNYLLSATLLVVYSNTGLPYHRVSINENIGGINPSNPSIAKTATETYSGILGGTADIWIQTFADEPPGPYPGGTNETIMLNKQVIGGPIDGNLGQYASLLHLTNQNVASGTNLVSIRSPQDYFAWALTVLTTQSIDLSVDSDNTDGFNSPDQTTNQEKIKDDPTLPGKLLTTDTNSDNANNLPDYANFKNPTANEQFVPIVLTLPTSLNFNAATVTFDYSSSDPALLGINNAAAGGSLRIWTKPGQSPRNPSDVKGGGDYVAGGKAYTAASLGFTSGITPNAVDGVGTNSVTLYVEGIAPSMKLGDLRIVAKVDPDGTGKGVATDAVRVTDVQVRLKQIDFNGAGNVNIRINDNKDIGFPLGANNPQAGDDIEWARGDRDRPNLVNNSWETNQSAPAAFLKGNPITASVIFDVEPKAITQITVGALNRTDVITGKIGEYGDVLTEELPVNGGLAKGEMNTDILDSDSNVDVNTLSFFWQLKSVIPQGGNLVNLAANIQKTQHRIYTLYSSPVDPANPNPGPNDDLYEPRADVLELAAGIVKLQAEVGNPLGGAQGDDEKIVAQLTRGIYNSLWTQFAANAVFIKPTGQLDYQPASPKSLPLNAFAPGGTGFVNQLYNISGFLFFLSTENLVQQQCNDNANLLAILADSLGIKLVPMYFSQIVPADTNDPSTLLPPTTYFGAGRAGMTTDSFIFHQVGVFNGKIYDPSTAETSNNNDPPNRNPRIANSFDAYLQLFAPAYYPLATGVDPNRKPPITQNVTTIRIL